MSATTSRHHTPVTRPTFPNELEAQLRITPTLITTTLIMIALVVPLLILAIVAVIPYDGPSRRLRLLMKGLTELVQAASLRR